MSNTAAYTAGMIATQTDIVMQDDPKTQGLICALRQEFGLMLSQDEAKVVARLAVDFERHIVNAIEHDMLPSLMAQVSFLVSTK